MKLKFVSSINYTVMFLEAVSYKNCRQYLSNFFLQVLPRRFIGITYSSQLPTYSL